jgi:hypothetical protein
MVGDKVFAIGTMAWVWFAVNRMIKRGQGEPLSGISERLIEKS